MKRFSQTWFQAFFLCAALLLSTVPVAAAPNEEGTTGRETPSQTSDPRRPVYTPFPATDRVATAMTTLWQAQFRADRDPDAARVALSLQDEAAKTVLSARPVAVRHLLQALENLSEGDFGGHLSMLPLLHLIGDDSQILAHFHYSLMDAAPVPSPGTDEAPIPEEGLARRVQMAQITAAAANGSELARDQLADLLRSADPAVRKQAVKGFYRASPNRIDAQREMRRLLDPRDHYLLYRR